MWNFQPCCRVRRRGGEGPRQGDGVSRIPLNVRLYSKTYLELGASPLVLRMRIWTHKVSKFEVRFKTAHSIAVWFERDASGRITSVNNPLPMNWNYYWIHTQVETDIYADHISRISSASYGANKLSGCAVWHKRALTVATMCVRTFVVHVLLQPTWLVDEIHKF